MLKKINKLISFSKSESNEIYNKLISLAQKIEDNTPSGKTYLLIDIKDMESMVDPSKVDGENDLGNVEIELWNYYLISWWRLL